MSDLILSTDLNVITAEINSYKQIAGQSIFEIGKRLKHVKENDLVHGQWESWCENSLKMTARQARKYIAVFDEFSKRKLTSALPSSLDALNLLVGMTDEQINQPHQIPSTGEIKTFDEMTVKEIQEVKRSLKETERLLKEAENAKRVAENRNRELEQQLARERNKPPQVIEKEVVKEVVPEKIRKDLDFEKSRADILSREIVKLEDKIRAYEAQEIDGFNPEVAEIKRKRLEMESEINALQIRAEIKSFLQRNAITAFAKDMLASADKDTKRKINETISSLEQFIDELKSALNGTMIIQEAQYEEVI